MRHERFPVPGELVRSGARDPRKIDRARCIPLEVAEDELPLHRAARVRDTDDDAVRAVGSGRKVFDWPAGSPEIGRKHVESARPPNTAGIRVKRDDAEVPLLLVLDDGPAK